MPGIIIVLKYPKLFFLFNWEGKNVSEYSDLGNCWQKIMRNDKNNVTIQAIRVKCHYKKVIKDSRQFRRNN